MIWFRRTPEHATVIELDLGPDDILLIESDQDLSDSVCKRLKDAFNEALDKPGRTTIVLSCGLRAKVIHRRGFVTNIINVPAGKA